MTLITYKDKAGKEVQMTNSFSGFAIKKEYNKISSITEYSNGGVLGTISFRPTKNPVIFSVKYGNYREDRYSHGGVSAMYSVNTDNICNGEYRKFLSDGTLHEVRYFNDGKEVTQDIMTFLNFYGTKEEFMDYKFREDEQFNIWMQYGGFFKFIHEYSYNSLEFDEKVQYCLK